MSHLKQRKEKSCLNCNAAINGRYCSICGQENLEPQESVWHLISHFFNDITHFDGKFFSSVKYVVTKPGFLCSEYMAGRRMSYLNPVRFYVFTSFVFFFVIFTFFAKGGSNKISVNKDVAISQKDSLKLIKNAGILGLDSIQIENIIKNHGLDSLERFINNDLSGKVSNELNFPEDYRDRKQYDSLHKIGKVNEGYIDRQIIEKQFQLQEKYGRNSKKLTSELFQTAIHLVPQMLFISLPFFALFLKLIYIRRKKFYYVAHAIFTIHLYIFAYLQILLITFLNKIAEVTHQGWLSNISVLVGLCMFYYLYKAMRNFYEQSRGKTLFKLILLIIFLFFLFLFFTMLLFGLSLYKM